MSLAFEVFGEKSHLKSLLEHFSRIEDPREPWRVAHPLAEVLLWWSAPRWPIATITTPSPPGEKRMCRFFVAIWLIITAFPAVAG